MKISDIQPEWSKDSAIDILNLTNESAQTPVLHHKYLSYLMEAKANLRTLHVRLAKLKALKKEWYAGDMEEKEMKELGWFPPFGKRLIKSDIAKYVDDDSDVITLTSMIGEANEVVQYLEEILRQINGRGFQIKACIDWERFKAGN